MKAAVLHASGQPPRFEEFPDPTPNDGEVVVRVKAAAIKNVDRMMALGTHYDSYSQFPAIVGVDGVGVLEDGTRVLCGGVRHPYGMMAEQAVVSRQRCLPIPDGVDDVVAAALPNPALSSWLPLVWRAQLKPGETVLILGATGVAGKLAVQIAKIMGAGRVVAAGRNEKVLKSLHDLGADSTISLSLPDDELAAAFAGETERGNIDVILDYLWGRPTEVLLNVLTGHDFNKISQRVRLVEIGEMAGPTIKLHAEALRSSGVEIYGSGGGSIIPPKAIFEALPKVWELAIAGKLHIDVETVPLSEVEKAWQREDIHGRRLVVVP
jgi:NADPH:quinone reductase-like Zn-dependent oxidoreductase